MVTPPVNTVYQTWGASAVLLFASLRPVGRLKSQKIRSTAISLLPSCGGAVQTELAPAPYKCGAGASSSCLF